MKPRETASETEKNARNVALEPPHLGTESRDYSEGRQPAIRALLANGGWLGQGRDQLTGPGEIGAALKLLGDLGGRVQALHVPGIELAQVALGTIAAEM